MTDRELLEKAAKVAGIGDMAVWSHFSRREWNPLEDDGDALRLAVKLRLLPVVEDWSDGPWVFVPSQPGNAQPFSADIYAATRRAIVRAAADLADAAGAA